MSPDQRHRTGSDSEPSLSSLLGQLRRSWLPMLLAVVLAGSSSYVVSQTLLPVTYESSATVIIIPQEASGEAARANPALNAFLPDQSIAETFRLLAGQMAVAAVASEDLRVPERQLRGQVSVHALPRTPLLRIAARSDQPEESSRLARGYSAALVRVAKSEGWVPGVDLGLASPASSPGEQIAPRPLLNAAVAGLVAVLLSLLVAAVADRRQTRRHAAAARSELPARAARHPSSSKKAADPEWAS